MYFDKSGKDNTQQTLELAAQRAKELEIKEVVVASVSGFTAYEAIEIFDGPRITVVTYHSGFKEPFKSEMPEKVKNDLHKKGVTVILTTHYLDEADILSDRICVIDQGAIKLLDRPKNLKEKWKSKNLEDIFLQLINPRDGNE